YLVTLFVLLSFFFFFSSRRRHTRFSRDWSSDVCSSDLLGRMVRAHRENGGAVRIEIDDLADPAVVQHRGVEHRVDRRLVVAQRRSEERRVGKEWRSRWGPQH